jgi:hypothetical protein
VQIPTTRSASPAGAFDPLHACLVSDCGPFQTLQAVQRIRYRAVRPAPCCFVPLSRFDSFRFVPMACPVVEDPGALTACAPGVLTARAPEVLTFGTLTARAPGALTIGVLTACAPGVLTFGARTVCVLKGSRARCPVRFVRLASSRPLVRPPRPARLARRILSILRRGAGPEDVASSRGLWQVNSEEGVSATRPAPLAGEFDPPSACLISDGGPRCIHPRRRTRIAPPPTDPRRSMPGGMLVTPDRSLLRIRL